MNFLLVILAGLAGAGASAGLIFLGLVFLKKQISSAVGAERDTFIKEIPEKITEASSLIRSADNYGSRPQLEFIVGQIQTTNTDLEKEKNSLKATETRLEQAQKDVEQKEAAQQEIKTANEEEDLRIRDMMAKFESLSSDSMALEHKLANSMKNLDRLMTEVELTPDQKGALLDLSAALTSAGSQLRDLLTEYNTVKERLQTLKEQHHALEDEYTRLVEQQLGE